MAKHMIKPYGDTLNDGLVQLAFTLPVPNSARAKKAAKRYVEQLNFKRVSVSSAIEIAEGFTYFVVYGKALPEIDFDSIEASEATVTMLDFYQINERIKTRLNRKITVVGASIGTDAHTVGIDAVMNMKGYKMDYGLERYPEIQAFNMGAQVPIEALLQKALDEDAEVILVSQTVTQKDAHLQNFTEFIELLEAESVRNRFLVLAGGPRVTNELAIELGYDAGFGRGTLPSHVASFIVTSLEKQQG